MFHPRTFDDVADDEELNDLMWFTCFFGCLNNPVHVHAASFVIAVLDVAYSFYLLVMIYLGNSVFFLPEFMMMLFMASVLIIGNKSDRPRLYNAWLIWKGLVLITRLFSATYLILMIAKYVHKVSILEDYTRIPVLRDVFQQKTPESFSLFMTMTSIILEIHFWQIIYYGKRYLIDRHSDEERRFKKFFHSQSDDNSRSYFIIREEDEEEFLRSRINSV